MAGQGGKGIRTGVSFGRPGPGKPIEFLNEREFCECFFIPNGVSIQLVEGDPTTTEKDAHNVILFSNEQFNAGSTFLFYHFSNNSYTTPRSLQPIFIPTSSRC